MDYISVEQALDILKANNIEMKAPNFRQQLRAGKIKGVRMFSKKEGYLIPTKNLLMYIYTKKNDHDSIYKLGYSQGLNEGISLGRTH